MPHDSVNTETVRACMDGWNRGDEDAWLARAHPEIEWYSAVAARMEGAETVRRGEAGLRAFWDEWHAVWDLKVELPDVRDVSDDVVLALGTMSTHGEASGVDLDTSVGWVFEFDGGLMRTVRAYLSHAEASEAAGIATRAR